MITADTTRTGLIVYGEAAALIAYAADDGEAAALIAEALDQAERHDSPSALVFIPQSVGGQGPSLWAWPFDRDAFGPDAYGQAQRFASIVNEGPDGVTVVAVAVPGVMP